MGNNQSSTQKNAEFECPSLCKALCFRSPSNDDEGEWFGDLPRDKNKKRRKLRTGRRASRLPSVPEEATNCSDTTETDVSSVPSLPIRTESKSVDEGDGEGGSSRPKLNRGATEPQLMKPSSRGSKVPTTKLTFANGQFVDLTTEEGRKIAESSAAREKDADEPSHEGCVRGVETHVASGHCGIISETSDTKSPSRSLAALPSILKKRSSFTSSFLLRESDQAKESLKESVASIVMLGDGYFLTAAVADRNIKMWKLTNDGKSDGSTSVTFIRNFPGCTTGITCLTRVDKKGRFLSGSKSGTVMLWDSRFNCDDPKEGEGKCQQLNENQVLLATFEKVERRRVDTMAMIEDGSYVRPTDDVDWSMMSAMTKKAMKEGSASVQRAARERQIIACSLQFASITGAHRTVKIWSVKGIDEKNDEKMEEGSPWGKNVNVAEVTLLQQLDHENVIESVATVLGKSMLLAGDRMGSVTLWKGLKNVFKRGSPKVWQSIRVFNWRHKLDLHKCQESMQFGITSLSFLGEGFFVSGARGGALRIWNVNGSGAKDETVNRELIGLSGAHTSEVTSIVTGKNVKECLSKEKMMTFNTCGKDGIVLSFMVPAEKPIPRCFNVVDLGIADRYTSDGDSVSALALGCHEKDEITRLIVGSSVGNINILDCPYPSLGPQDALLAYRQQIEEECLTLQVIAENAFRTIKCTNHKKHMHTYADCFTGSDLVSYLVDKQHAATRSDGVTLGRALQKNLSLFCHVSKECELLQDDIRSFYHFCEEYKKMKGATLRKLQTM